jgi:hypothetical protein
MSRVTLAYDCDIEFRHSKILKRVVEAARGLVLANLSIVTGSTGQCSVVFTFKAFVGTPKQRPSRTLNGSRWQIGE